ncbi:L,D-transpeptidase [Neorhizobium sp. JUb45]|uniref:L,D-transpeptidase n=1 Tax=unclassified Neorhizobium TaxID=2629175 RepID=UPI0010DD1E1B|nr:L,D-transpeptidase [Neorhizobium sp. JUb45]TCR06990.1 lipoprotein-anchoring transpeptidase ErfK/SrfK [Neorhizobium sp. JUb45]
MKRSLVTSLSLIALTAVAAPVQAQVMYRDYGGAPQYQYERQYGGEQPTLVTPEGYILDYTPEPGEFVVTRDRNGRRTYMDRAGNVVATEMQQQNRRDRGGYARSEQMPGVSPGYRDYRDYRGNGSNGGQYDGEVTGSVPDRGSITRLPLDAPSNDPAQYDPNYASIEPNQTQPLGPEPRHSGTTITVTNKPQAEIAALQVFLDREGISPGVIDGRLGDNVNKAIAAWQEMTGETLDPNNAEDIVQRLSYSGGMPIVEYTITAADAAGPYVASIPDDYAHKAQLPALSYTSTSEKLAEQFHMDEGYLKAINPNVDFTIPGTIIKVISPGQPKTGEVTRIIADKGRKQVFAYGADGKLISAYPATIGSSDTPSPVGNHTVARIALNPGYTYNPKINFTQGENREILQIPPGPNGPVGTVWIALSKPTYGIHGTPEPSKIGKTNSHGCIRLTNWDATELAKMVKPGTTVEFVE